MISSGSCHVLLTPKHDPRASWECRLDVKTLRVTEAKLGHFYSLTLVVFSCMFSETAELFFKCVWFEIIFHFDKAGFKVIFIFVLAERPKYTFDFSEEEEDDADDDDDNNDLEELKVKASPITNDGEDEFVPSDGLDKDEYTFSPGKSKAIPE